MALIAEAPFHVVDYSEACLIMMLPVMLRPEEFQTIVSVCPSWRRAATQHIASAGVARLLLEGAYAMDLEKDAMRLCHLTIQSSWFSPSHYTVAVLAFVGPGGDELDAFLRLSTAFPAYLALPSRDVRAERSSRVEEGAWYFEAADEVVEAERAEPHMLRDMSRHWGSAYVGLDGSIDEAAQALYKEVVQRVRALWAIARCGTCGPPVARRRRAAFRSTSLRAAERWSLAMVSMSIGVGSSSTAGLALMVLSYHEGRLLG
mmetsp:Transcript_62346/g.179314  ORF Transcript_62346/g.179314 Transcript_62346/m.179314 type:complete len:260 (+) Transcript_62346:66-845(+)